MLVLSLNDLRRRCASRPRAARQWGRSGPRKPLMASRLPLPPMRSGKLSPISDPSPEAAMQPRSPGCCVKTCPGPAPSSRPLAHATRPLREFGRRRCPAAKHWRMTSAGTFVGEPRRGRRVSNKPNSLPHSMVGGRRRRGRSKPRALLHDERHVVAERGARATLPRLNRMQSDPGWSDQGFGTDHK